MKYLFIRSAVGRPKFTIQTNAWPTGYGGRSLPSSRWSRSGPYICLDVEEKNIYREVARFFFFFLLGNSLRESTLSIYVLAELATRQAVPRRNAPNYPVAGVNNGTARSAH